MRTPNRKSDKYVPPRPDPLITRAKFDELKNKLTKLKELKPKLAVEVAALAQNGDFSENVEYQIAKGRLRGVNNGIQSLESQLYQAQIIDPDQQTDIIKIGHKVTVEVNGTTKIYQILGSVETSPQNGIISHQSPIGFALMDHKVGDVVKIKLADKEVEYKIIGVE